MKNRMQTVFGLFAVILIATAGVSFAQKEQGDKKASAGQGVRAYAPAKGRRINAFMVDKIVGSKVLNMKGEDLGTVEDIVVDIDSGRILYAVLDFGGFLGIGGKLFPVPWHSLAPLPSEGVFYLNISKEKVRNAPAYNKNDLPDMGDIHWGTKIAAFYELPGPERYYNYDYDYGYGYGYGLGLYPGLAQKDPFAEIFDPKSMKKISGEVIKVDQVIPEKGLISQMETELVVLTDRREPVPVFLGPKWYIMGLDRMSPFKSGDKVTVSGSWITTRTEPFLIATTVTEGNRTLRVRYEDGTPIWSGWEMEKTGE